MKVFVRTVKWWVVDTIAFIRSREWYPEENLPVRLMSPQYVRKSFCANRLTLSSGQMVLPGIWR